MGTNYYNMKGSEILKSLESHCNEKLECSHRLKYQIEQTLNRLVQDHNAFVSRIDCVLKGFEVYDPTVKRAIHLSKNK